MNAIHGNLTYLEAQISLIHTPSPLVEFLNPNWTKALFDLISLACLKAHLFWSRPEGGRNHINVDRWLPWGFSKLHCFLRFWPVVQDKFVMKHHHFPAGKPVPFSVWKHYANTKKKTLLLWLRRCYPKGPFHLWHFSDSLLFLTLHLKM